MSLFSKLKKLGKEKTELKDKMFIKDDSADLDNVFKINAKQVNKDEIDLTNAVKITDKYLIARMINSIPELADLLIKNKDVLYKFALPAVKGRIENAYKKNDKNDIPNKDLLDKIELNGDNQVALEIVKYLSKNFKNFKPKTTLMATAVVVSAEIASKYIVNEINKNLDAIGYEVKEIRNFLTTEYKSKIEETSLFLEKTLAFKDEILSNDSRKKEKISQIEDHISTCIQLLQQAMIIINESTKDIRDNYFKYEKAVYELEDWLANLKTLYSLIAELCKIDYLFYQGTASLESCEYDVKLLRPEIKECLLGLNNWHQIEQLKLEINIEKGIYKNTGIKAMIKKFFSSKNYYDDINYSKIEDDVLMMIEKQMGMNVEQFDLSVNEIFNNNIDLVIANGDIYYCNYVM